MGKRTYESDIIAMALLYRKKYANTDIIPYDKIRKFDTIINKNLDDMEASCGIGIRNESISNLYFIIADENGKACAAINPNANLKVAWEYHINCLPTEVLIASEMDNALKEIGLITVNEKTIDRNSYYNELKEKYNLLYEFTRPKFDIFKDWENLSEESFVEKFCISNAEQLILKELRETKKTNEQNAKKQITILKKIKGTKK